MADTSDTAVPAAETSKPEPAKVYATESRKPSRRTAAKPSKDKTDGGADVANLTAVAVRAGEAAETAASETENALERARNAATADYAEEAARAAAIAAETAKLKSAEAARAAKAAGTPEAADAADQAHDAALDAEKDAELANKVAAAKRKLEEIQSKSGG
jgi:colicin import membrane protein